MTKLNLTKLTANELKTKEMSHLTGGGNTCKGGKCGTNYSNGVNKTLKNMRDNNPLPQDTIQKDTIPLYKYTEVEKEKVELNEKLL